MIPLLFDTVSCWPGRGIPLTNPAYGYLGAREPTIVDVSNPVSM